MNRAFSIHRPAAMDGAEVAAPLFAAQECRVYPLMLAALAVSAAGTAASMKASSDAADAQAKTRAEFVNKQAELQRQASDVFQKSASKSTKAKADESLAKGTDERAQLASVLKAATEAQTGAALPGSSSASYEVADTAGDASRRGQADATNRLASYSDWTSQQARDNADAMQQMAPIGSKSRGNAGIFPIQMDAAGHSADELSNWGKVLSAVGAAGSMAAGAGWGTGANAVTPLSSISSTSYPMANNMINSAAQAQQANAVSNWASGPSLWSSLYN